MNYEKNIGKYAEESASILYNLLNENGIFVLQNKYSNSFNNFYVGDMIEFKINNKKMNLQIENIFSIDSELSRKNTFLNIKDFTKEIIEPSMNSLMFNIKRRINEDCVIFTPILNPIENIVSNSSSYNGVNIRASIYDDFCKETASLTKKIKLDILFGYIRQY